jgi:hypothetical protein
MGSVNLSHPVDSPWLHCHPVKPRLLARLAAGEQGQEQFAGMFEASSLTKQKGLQRGAEQRLPLLLRLGIDKLPMQAGVNTVRPQ